MKKALITGALIAGLTGLAGCSDSDSDVDEEELISIITEALITGSWLKCENDNPPASFSNLLTFNGDGTGTAVQTRFTDPDCTTEDGSQTPNNEVLAYILEAETTVDGTVAGITDATGFNLSISGGAIEFNVIALSSSTSGLLLPDTLHFGDTDADPAKDGSAADKRPTTLEDAILAFEKQ